MTALSGIRLVGLTVGAAMLLAGVGYFPTRSLAGGAGVVGMLVGLAIAMLASLAGLAPALAALGGSALDRHKALLTGMAVRLLTALVLTVSAVLSGLLHPTAVVVWVAIGYLTLLGIDTAATVRLIRQSERTAE